MRGFLFLPPPGRETGMVTCANALALFGMVLLRIGGRGGGFAFFLFGLAIVAVVGWALTRPMRNTTEKNRRGKLTA